MNLLEPELITQSIREGTTAKDIYPLVHGIKVLFSEKKYEEVDRILMETDLTTLGALPLVTLVRTTYPARDDLKNWRSCVLRVRNQLVLRELDANHMLRGLE